ncbi:hypothetical protein PHAVU_010G064700 [Phaseolus vulgaris]|uniref:Rx N-terminal domain-containing protein n=1 Tax=Phaseolus vulgaris TaxID=3885 RepID=V7AN01_PHAVU|nr:hypothetical protein PHAVU_010G064700g [Phaseolus vulgaris]ESW06640.1 hypothetical protein PHAVU_010G064700g [Phaseolus vulgaris]
MALAVVGGALLSAFFDVLFDRLASPKLVNFIRGKKPNKLLQKMKSHLLVVRVVLADADKKQITDFNVKEWLDLLNDVVYEVDDLLDEVSTRAATQKEVSNSFSHLFNRKKIASISKLKDIVERLDDILKQKESLDLKENPVERNQPWKAQPTSLEDGYGIYGRDKDKEVILKMVLEDRADGEQVSVIPTVGMGGVGKTSLARSVYNDHKGSKVLMTTRNESVAVVVPFHSLNIYHLNKLSNEDCWLVFANHAFPLSEGRENRGTLEKIGKEIVKKCNGLSLAAQSLGGMLRRKHAVRDWNNILESDIWELPKSQCKIIPALRISYNYLPPHLKRCFVYCSLSCKNTKTKEKKERLGDEYFDDLVSRPFFQFSSQQTWGNYFVMHDLMPDLATFLGGEFYFREDELGKETKIDRKTHIEVFKTLKFPRTFLLINCKISPFNNEQAAHNIVSMLKYLRVCFIICDFQSPPALPDSIGELIHLRYLNLSHTSTATLSESLCNLYNLQTLKLSWCLNLTKLPSAMQNLANLRHLEIFKTSIKEMPKRMGKLNQIQKLDLYIVGKHKENSIKELGGLPNPHGWFCIKKLENVTNGEEELEARIMDKKHIDGISLECNLQPHQHLKGLSISGYKGTGFPEWVGNFSSHNITNLHFYKKDNMRCWEVWSSFDSEAFPVLRSLNIVDCPKLKGDLPNHLPALLTLRITNCELLVSSIHKSNKVTFLEFPLLVERIEGGPMVESMMETIANIQPTCRQSLTLKDCSSAISFPTEIPERKRTCILFSC